MQRRDVLVGGAVAALAASVSEAAAQLADIPIIDTHIHLFDARRPQAALELGDGDGGTGQADEHGAQDQVAGASQKGGLGHCGLLKVIRGVQCPNPPMGVQPV